MTDSLDSRFPAAPDMTSAEDHDPAMLDIPAKPAAETARAPAPPAPAPPADPIAAAPARAASRWRSRILLFGLPLLIAVGAAIFWFSGGNSVSTDNAYVQQDKVSVSSDVAGRIVEVAVRENQAVKAGDLLFRVDPEPYRIALAQAEAAIANAQVQEQTLESGYAAMLPDIDVARESVAQAKETYSRQSQLMKQGFTTRAQFEAAGHALAQARASVASAQADAAEARAKLASGASAPGRTPALALAQAQRDKAALDLARTEVRAPIAGVVSQADRLQIGQMMVTGLPAVSIVASGTSWVEANFKETDLDRMQIGQKAEVTLDSYRGIKLVGHVASIGAGTGSEFSVLPAQNANGNWVKVTQRIPVRIAIDGKSSRQLIAGQSADVKVEFGDGQRR